MELLDGVEPCYKLRTLFSQVNFVERIGRLFLVKECCSVVLNKALHGKKAWFPAMPLSIYITSWLGHNSVAKSGKILQEMAGAVAWLLLWKLL